MDKVNGPVILAILDGWGYTNKNIGNPMNEAKLPAISMIMKNYPMTLLQASGKAVGMSWGESGNSEVGHMNIGAGRIVQQYRNRIQRSIEDGSFYKNTSLLNAFQNAKTTNGTVHLIGLLTSGTVHADYNHIIATIKMASEQNCTKLMLHLFLDGKDSGLKESLELIPKLKKDMEEYSFAKIATIIGRNYAMDREGKWEKIKLTYDLIISAQGEKVHDIEGKLKELHSKDMDDSAMPPLVLQDTYSGVNDGDSVIFFNFREDSMRELLNSFENASFDKFPNKKFLNLFIVSMTPYKKDQLSLYAFATPDIKNTLAETVSSAGKTQFHISETQKYAHITYFINGLKDNPPPNETDFFIESPKSIEDEPRLKAEEIAQTVQNEIDKNKYDIVMINIANADVVAHTGKYKLALEAVRAVDKAVEILYNLTIEKNGTLIITADHGNAEEMIYKKTGEPESKHNQNPVPFIIVRKDLGKEKDEATMASQLTVTGILGDIAPTILEIMSIPQPIEMTGTSLLSKMGVNK